MRNLLLAAFSAAVLGVVLYSIRIKLQPFDIGRVRDGMSMSQTREVLGEPDASADRTVPQGRFFGMAPPRSPGSTYTEWTYTRARTVYLIWFASVGTDPELRVIGTANYPAGAVF